MSADLTPIEERAAVRIAGTAGAPLRAGGGPDARRLLTRTWILVAIVVFVTALVLGRIVLVPLALASVFGFLLAPLASRFERARLGRGPSAVLAVTLLVGAVLGVSWIAASQTADLARRMPEYASRIQTKLSGLETSGLATPFVRGVEGWMRLETGLAGKTGAPSSGAVAPPAASPVDVRVVGPPSSLVGNLTALLGPLLAPIGSAAIVVLLTIFLLCYRADLRDRLIRLVSRSQIGLTSQALGEASRRLSRYLVAMVIVNTMCGVVIGAGLAIVGVPNAPLWGLLAGLLRFVPYVGVWIGALAPVALSLAVFDGWGHTIAVLLVVLGTDLVAGNVVEPRVYGKEVGISPLAVVVATIFWTAIWGFPGLLLALPMTLCLAVVGRYVPGLEFLDVLLGDAPALSPAERVYERLAALDPDGARRVAEESVASVGTDAMFDDVLLAALRLASVGRRLGVLEDARFHDLCVGLLEATDGLARPDPAVAHVAVAGRVLCLPAGDDADRVACELLARLLAARGIEVEVGSPTSMSGELAEQVEKEPSRVVCIASIPPLAAPRVRYLVKRIRGRAPDAKIVAAVWEPKADQAVLTESLAGAGADHVAVTLPQAIEGIRRLLAEIMPPSSPDEKPLPSLSQRATSA